MAEILLVAGLLIASFVAYNVGGSSTGPAFGPAVGADVLTKTVAAALMSVFFFAGAWTIGRRVVETLGRDLLQDPSLFTLEYSILVLLFVGGGLLLGNLSGAPASTSMTAVGAIVGLGVAAGELRWAVVGEILSWWLISPVIGFWTAVMIGRVEERVSEEVESEVEDRVETEIDDRVREEVEARLVDRLREIDEGLASQVETHLENEASS